MLIFALHHEVNAEKVPGLGSSTGWYDVWVRLFYYTFDSVPPPIHFFPWKAFGTEREGYHKSGITEAV